MTAAPVPAPVRADLHEHVAATYDRMADEHLASEWRDESYAAGLRAMAALRRGWAAGMRAEGAM